MNMIVRSTAAMAAVPAIAQASPMLSEASLPDPVFAAIERHQQAIRVLEAAEGEVARLYDLADEIVGTSSIPVLDMRDNDSGCHLYVDAFSTYEISDLTPGLKNQGLRIFYINKFEQRKRERKAITGDTDALLAEPVDQLLNAEEALLETTPTTLPGLLALFAHLGKLVTANPDLFEEQPDYAVLFVRLGKSAEQLGGQIA